MLTDYAVRYSPVITWTTVSAIVESLLCVSMQASLANKTKSYLLTRIHNHCCRHSESATRLPNLFPGAFLLHVPVVSSCIVKQVTLQNSMRLTNQSDAFTHLPHQILSHIGDARADST